MKRYLNNLKNHLKTIIQMVGMLLLTNILVAFTSTKKLNTVDPPTITNFAGAGIGTTNVNENTTTSFIDIDATDTDGDTEGAGTLTYSLSGTDAALFQIDGLGMLSFISAPDAETPQQGGATANEYFVTITVTDSESLTDTLDLTVIVDDVCEAQSPSIVE